MKIPIFRYFKIKDNSLGNLEQKFLEFPFEQSPIVIELDNISGILQAEILIDKIETLLNSLNHSHRFPHGVYIISPYIPEDCSLIVVDSKQKLPFFYRKSDQLVSQTKESKLLKKYHILCQRNHQINPEKRITQLQELTSCSGQLTELIHVGIYYEKLLDQLNKQK